MIKTIVFMVVTILIAGCNNPSSKENSARPTASAQNVTTNENKPKKITLIGDDQDGDKLTYTIVTHPVHGTLSGTAPNLTYTPNANYHGSDSFRFKVNDGHTDSTPATVRIEVQPKTKSDLKSKDITPPVIHLNGADIIKLNKGDIFIDPGASASDDKDGDISSKITRKPATIDTSAAGEHEIIYTVYDKAGNIATAKRKVIVMQIISDPESTKPKQLVINEVLATNSHTKIDPDYKQFSDYIELFNNSGKSVNLGSYYLSDNVNRLNKWKLPSKILNDGDRILIWADKQDTGLHTNFSLDGDGETVTLSQNGTIIDQITFKKQKRDISVTRLDDKNYYMVPTPGTPNQNALGTLFKSQKPAFNKESGFYTGTQEVSLSQENGATIYYTTDGSIPTTDSSVYSHPITIDKTTIIRARALEKGKFMSSVVNHTFLINENVHLPVVSIFTDERYLFDDKIGIYTNGTDERGRIIPSDPRGNANYDQPWIRPAGIEYIKNGNTQFSENVAISVFGGYTRRYSKKSLAIYAKDQFGTKSIKYPLFPHKPFIKKVKSFILRSGGNAWRTSVIKDAVLQSLVRDHMDLSYQDFQPVVLFLNGKYYGVSNLREKMNKDYIEANFHIDTKKTKVEVLEKNGDESSDYQSLLAYVKQNSLSSEEQYNYIQSHIDINSYLNYYVTEVYLGNTDWPNVNIKYWKADGGKWRWCLYDLDRAAFNTKQNTLLEATSPLWYGQLFKNLLKNKYIKNRFLGKYITHMHTTFSAQRVTDKFDAMQQIIEPEMSRDIQRWRNAPRRRIHSLSDWRKELKLIKDNAEDGPQHAIRYLKSYFHISRIYNLTLQTSDYGKIIIDEVTLDNDFNTNYLAGSIVELQAIPDNEYRFVRWSDGNTHQTREVQLDKDKTLSAVFEPAPTPKIVINEINYKSDKNHDSGDWVELYNYGSTDIDLSGWKLKDDSISKGYTIPANTTLQPGTYLVICEDKAAFTKLYNTQAPVLGDFPFGLSKSEDSVKLYNNQGALVDQVHYDKTWPDAKGNGKTLALIDPDSDNNLSTNWIAADNFGTPGEAN